LTGFGFHLIEVEPGCETTEHHLHYHEDECVFVLDGEAMAIIGEEQHLIGPGDFLGYRKGGLAHSIRNTGKVTLRCIVVVLTGDNGPTLLSQIIQTYAERIGQGPQGRDRALLTTSFDLGHGHAVDARFFG